MEYETKIYVTFNYGGWSLRFSKEFNLPFTPFYNMVLYDEFDGYENKIELVTNDYCCTTIGYNTDEYRFIIDVRNVWKFPVSDETIDDILMIFQNTGWHRIDDTNIDDLKKLMN